MPSAACTQLRRIAALLLAILCLPGPAARAQPEPALPEASRPARGYLVIYHLDVGQGDATLIVAPSGETLLIDGGNRGVGRDVVVEALRRLKVQELDYVLATHYDADHIGGLDEVVTALRHVRVGAFDRGLIERDDPTVQYQEWVAAADDTARVVRHEPLALGRDIVRLGPDVRILVVAANGEVLRAAPQPGATVETHRPFELGDREENEKSLALRLSYGCFDYFIGGDLTGGGRSGSRRTKDLENLVAPLVGDVDVLKLNHHGSQTSSNPAFLAALDPEVAVISVGNGHPNTRYRHPARSVLDELHRLRGERSLRVVFQTNRGETEGGLTERDLELIRVADGNVVVFTDGSSYAVNGVLFATDNVCNSRE